ncbi:MAG: hypothetical protein K2M48_05735, partial [Clostridiales bacterium]|nr:hypothetical protein [Clostridiales bacterium]
ATLDGARGAGEIFYTPETLTVYSDNGVGGVVRAYHDIIREFGVPQARLEKRRAIVVYCPTDGGADLIEKRMTAAAATGADTVVVDVACGKDKALKYAEKTKAHGMRFGLKSEFSKAAALVDLVEACGAEYVELGCDDIETYEHAATAYALYVELKNKYSNIEIDFGHKKSGGSAEDRLKSVAYSPVPLCAVRNTVDGEGLPLKTAFDVASFGALGYKLDPAKLNEGALRAIRAQIQSYQDDATTVNLGDVYEIGGGIMAVGKDKSKAFAATAGEARFDGLDVHNLYHVRELGKTFSGAALGFYGLKENGDGTVTYHIRQVADYE